MQGAGITCVPCSSSFVLSHSRASLVFPCSSSFVLSHSRASLVFPCSSSFVLPHFRASLRMKNNFNFCRLRVRAQKEDESNLSTSENTSETVTDPIEPVDPIDPTPVKLTPLPYSFDALEPHMSKETVEHHWDKLHRGHVDRLNDLIKGTEFADMTLMKMVTTSYNKGDPLPFFPHAAQVWNHNFFWHSMSPVEAEKPSGRLSHLINRDFGSFEALSNEIKKAALTQFGSGWVWLAYKANRLGVGNDINPRPSEKDARLVVAKTPNAINPLVWGYFPLLAIDVWEHAYYMDYENRRGDYVSRVLENLVSWEKVGFRLDTLIESIREKTTREHEEMVRRKKMEERIRQRIKELSRKEIASSKKMNVMNTPSRRGRGRGR